MQTELFIDRPVIEVKDWQAQWARVYSALLDAPRDTNHFCAMPGLAAEYRRAIVELRRKLPKPWTVKATPLTRKNWEYRLERVS